MKNYSKLVSKNKIMEKLTIIKKGWCLNKDKLQYSEYDYISCYANNRNKAKKKMLEHSNIDLILNINGENLNYINIPVVRNRKADIVLFNGKEVRRDSVLELSVDEIRKKEIKKLNADESIVYCYIRKGGYYYAKDCKVYKQKMLDAGVYTKEEAIKHYKHCRELTIVPIDVDEHNKMINDRIEELKSNLFNPPHPECIKIENEESDEYKIENISSFPKGTEIKINFKEPKVLTWEGTNIKVNYNNTKEN